MFDRLLKLFRSEKPQAAPRPDEFSRAINTYVKGLSATRDTDIDASSVEGQAGLVLSDIGLRALIASGHLAQVNDIDEQIALLMFLMLASAPLVVHLRQEGHDISHDRVIGIAAAAFMANLDRGAREQVFDLSAGLFKRFLEQAREKAEFDDWLATTRRLIWALVVSDEREMRQALAGHYIALRMAVDQLR